MTNTSDEYWSVDGVSLQTFAHDVESVGPKFTPPPMRGDDILVPYAAGRRWIAKQPDSRVIPLQMWVRGINDDGSKATNAKHAFDDNFSALRDLLWTPGRQFTLTKRFYRNGTLVSASALAEYESGLEATMLGRTGAQFLASVRLAQPYFYADTVTHATLVNGNNTVTVPGDVETERISINIFGPRVNTVIQNTSPLDLQVEYHDSLLTGATVDIEVKDYVAKTTPSGSPQYTSTAKVRNSGDARWLLAAPGANTFHLASDSGIGAVTLDIYGAYL